MCNRYTPPKELEIEREWHVGRQNPIRWWDDVLFPRGQGAFIRRARDGAGYSRELVVGQWGLIPWFAKEPKLKYPTNNARSEEMADKASYKLPWAGGSAASSRPPISMSPTGSQAKTCGGGSGGRTVTPGA